MCHILSVGHYSNRIIASLGSALVFVILAIIAFFILIVALITGHDDLLFVYFILVGVFSGLSVLSLVMFQYVQCRQKQYITPSNIIECQPLSEPVTLLIQVVDSI